VCWAKTALSVNALLRANYLETTARLALNTYV
jgi:hypothetical protein